jgi:protein-disulfide isomerase
VFHAKYDFVKIVHSNLVVVPLGLVLASCGGPQKCPAIDEEALAERVAELVLERLGHGEEADADKEVAGPARGEAAAIAELWPTDSGLSGADEPRASLPLVDAPWRGADEPLVTIVEFIDFQCPYCIKAQHTLERLLEEYPDDVRLVFRHHPLEFHDDAMPAAEACAEAFAQGGNDSFWRMHDMLIRNPRDLERHHLEAFAREIGLNANRFRRALDSGAHRAAIERDADLALSLGAHGTPAFFINGRELEGAQPYTAFEKIVREEIALAEEAMRRGARRDRIYDIVMATTRSDDEIDDSDEEDEPIHHVPVGDSPTVGPADALVTIVMFADIQCAYCARAYETIKAIRKRFDDDVRIVWKNHPLPLHAESMQSHRALMEARAQKGDAAAFDMLELMFADITRLELSDLERHARELKLSLPRFRKALKKEKHQAAIEQDLSLGDRLDVTGTPTFFINGVRIVGARTYYTFFHAVGDARERAQELVDRGVPRDRVYADIIRRGRGAPQER